MYTPMDNLARSRAVVTALRKVCPEFKPEWWTFDYDWRIERVCICPDLLAPAHLADLWAVCREIAKLKGVALFVNTLTDVFVTSRNPSEALMLAAEAALECGEEVDHA